MNAAKLIFRKASKTDTAFLMNIIKQAQADLKAQGVDQWQNGYPNEQTIQADISSGTSYVLLADGDIVGTACISFDGEPSYDKIYGGSWLSDYRYAVIHRIAVASAVKRNGFASALMLKALTLCSESGIKSIRADTHEKNTAMQGLLRKNQFTHCGTIYLSDGSSRIAYERLILEMPSCCMDNYEGL